MQKKILAALLVIMAYPLASSAYAATDTDDAPVPGGIVTTMRCAPPLIAVSAGDKASAQYLVSCEGARTTEFAPKVVFAGELYAKGTSPYPVKATYTVNTQGDHSARMLTKPRADQIATGLLTSSTVSLAALPSQFAQQMEWDASTGTLSVEESAGTWRVFSVMHVNTVDEPSVQVAGVASAPVVKGKTQTKITLGSKYSRFSGKDAARLPVVKAELRLRDGKLEVQLGETRVANQGAVQNALLNLDRQPKDLMRAWALAARAQFLGLDDEVRYAEQKVAAFHPDVLEEFQQAVSRIKPYSIVER